ncbi:MAG: ribonuclease III [candidate division Zixibacteria bacterium]|nr:ribonuclease III [Candidatus Tariuqbacter arcticus]
MFRWKRIFRRAAVEFNCWRLSELEERIGYRFRDPSLAERALRHRSSLQQEKLDQTDAYEQLEFLGDSVIGLIAAEYLFREYPDEDEGKLTQIKSLLVSGEVLSQRALALDLGRFLLMGAGEVRSGGRERRSILEDAFEALVGAVYLDGGLKAAQRFVQRHLLSCVDEIIDSDELRNYKSMLLEYAQSTSTSQPVYMVMSESGPDHKKIYTIEVSLNGKILGTGEGRSKKRAEQKAAREALEKLGVPISE